MLRPVRLIPLFAILLSAQIAAVSTVRAGGFLADVFVRPFSPQAADALDGAHRQIKEAIPPYKAAEEGASHLVNETLVQSGAPVLKNWIIESRNVALSRGVDVIPQEIRSNLQGFVADDILNRVRWRVGGGGELSLQQNAFRYGDALAITLDYVVVFKDENDALYNPSLWAHELGHVIQFRDWGIDDFAKRYLRNASSVEAQAEDHARRWSAFAAVNLASRAPVGSNSDLGQFRTSLRGPLSPITQSSGAGNVCRTPMGACQLPGSAAAGTPCWCNTAFGANVGSIAPGMQQLNARIANRCTVPTAGSCPMSVALPEMSSCACLTAYGTFPGTATVASLTNYCTTPIGICPVAQPLAVGDPCWCPTMQGPVTGTAQ
jgi:Domain of unknown function (DUF4157)